MTYTGDDVIRGRVGMNQFSRSDLSRMKHAGTRALYEYWTNLSAGRHAPYRSEISAEGVGRSLAGNTFILETLGAGNTRFRLAGSALYDIFGLEMRGMSALSIMLQDDRAKLRTLIETVLATPCVGVAQVTASTPGGVETQAEILLSPLRSDFEEMNRVLGSIHLLDVDEVTTASRRCRMDAAFTIALEPPKAHLIDGPLAGFAEAQTSFDGPKPESDAKPALTSIDGGVDAADDDGTERRKGHLRLVKD